MASFLVKISGASSLSSFAICIGTALILGILTSVIYNAGTHHTASFSLTIALLPAVVALVILLVQGNIGAGLGVAGSFSLIRFRSVPGSSREITGAFIAVALGLGCGMGFIGYTVLFFIIIAVVVFILKTLHFGSHSLSHQLKITIPENLDYDTVFDDVLNRYTLSWELVRVKTTNMGTLFELVYDITLPDGKMSKQFMDELRCLNSNLNILCGHESDKDSL